MKITKERLKQIIREESNKTLSEGTTGEEEAKLAVGIRNAIIEYLQEGYYGGRPLPGDVLRVITNYDPKISNIIEVVATVQS